MYEDFSILGVVVDFEAVEAEDETIDFAASAEDLRHFPLVLVQQILHALGGARLRCGTALVRAHALGIVVVLLLAIELSADEAHERLGSRLDWSANAQPIAIVAVLCSRLVLLFRSGAHIVGLDRKLLLALLLLLLFRPADCLSEGTFDFLFTLSVILSAAISSLQVELESRDVLIGLLLPLAVDSGSIRVRRLRLLLAEDVLDILPHFCVQGSVRVPSKQADSRCAIK